MKELTLKQKNSYIDYAIEDMLKDNKREFLCISYNNWYRKNIKNYEGPFKDNLILRFPELVQIIVKQLKNQKTDEKYGYKYNTDSNDFYLSAVDVVDGLNYRIRLLKRLKKQINNNFGTKEKEHGK